ncbi:MAG: 16S rRNA (guanine(966)-N(2))-methyltransferase RsmD [Desulfobacterales bacterium]|nr:16S rRNA (guanine(966)-N(2))-methyltransferase RsmD [Desulfobacterales bacterium]
MSLRVVGGKLKNRRLHSLSGKITRPTSEKIREAVFNILGESIEQAYVLDLYAGSGAIGMEALSRGAQYCVFIENHRDALAIIHKNIHVCQFEDKSQVISWDIDHNLDCLRQFHSTFNFVYIDPPYKQTHVLETLTHVADSMCLKNDALIIAEQYSGYDKHNSCLHKTITHVDTRCYSKTQLLFFRYEERKDI